MSRTRIRISLWKDYHERADLPALKNSFLHQLKYGIGKDHHSATEHDLFTALARAVRERLVDGMMATRETYRRVHTKRLYYLSLEYLIGRSLITNLLNLRELPEARAAAAELGLDFDALSELESDAGLGNGGLGRLAACFLDSLATLGYPATGYGIRYDFGIFRQEIAQGAQREHPDYWLRYGNPWEIARPDRLVSVPIYGRVEHGRDAEGRFAPCWVEARHIIGVPYDLPIAGFGNRTVHVLRLWSARASEELDLRDFDRGDYLEAVEEKTFSETISKVLYPNDSTVLGKELRFLQQYFFVCCSITDILSRHRRQDGDLSGLPQQAAIQLNDTHPTLAVLELLRQLLDVYHMGWDEAWAAVTGTFAYTNHTLMPEALERWGVDLFRRILPRHWELVQEVDRRFRAQVAARFPGDPGAVGRMAIIDGDGEGPVRMAHLAIAASHKVNGVAALHTELLQRTLVPDFARLWPEKFVNVTNGITPRRWLLEANPALSALITEAIGDDWITDLDRLHALEPLADDAEFRRRFRLIKRVNKEQFGRWLQSRQGVVLDCDHCFDVQVKRLHEYKRQHLNLLHAVDLYRRLREDPALDVVPRTFLFGGKAAPGYQVAKSIIRAITALAAAVDAEPAVRAKLRVVFLENYRVSLAQRLFPASEVSEQISTAGTEASGTGNMKFALNGALTLGTLDGATIEIREEVGPDHLFIFGMTADQVAALRGRYRPEEVYESQPDLRAAIDLLRGNHFTPDDPGALEPMLQSLLEGGDPFFVLADFAAYKAAHTAVDRAYRDQEDWNRKAILTVARMGKFSADRTIHEYAHRIWNLRQITVARPGREAPDR